MYVVRFAEDMKLKLKIVMGNYFSSNRPIWALKVSEKFHNFTFYILRNIGFFDSTPSKYMKTYDLEEKSYVNDMNMYLEDYL